MHLFLTYSTQISSCIDLHQTSKKLLEPHNDTTKYQMYVPSAFPQACSIYVHGKTVMLNAFSKEYFTTTASMSLGIELLYYGVEVRE